MGDFSDFNKITTPHETLNFFFFFMFPFVSLTFNLLLSRDIIFPFLVIMFFFNSNYHIYNTP